ncbi:twitching motility protein PilT [Kurthia zopfii]|uniref:Twitching mobility protein n=1 Tax=Kurthia zopfii TaxID=1650 RepID=A0A8B4QBU9_9BACL|nr:type IV pilus twitching motility protein PilT [Kurthia zopfii]PWI23997.1 type IV pili twitching motility protein PilT [Kurthia zopfii]TDR44249.1 twitching motility protein PilT [Kurthia zopfii]GEK29796.1 twitching motility protein PilT [Kurthia zopfii]STX10145.1 Twitching mobility protein [Kurthia zopfii]
MSKDLIELLTQADELNASDLHLTVGIPPTFRINGQLQTFDEQKLLPDDLQRIVLQAIPEFRRDEFEEKRELDFNYSLQNRCRFRMNAYHQRNSLTLAARKIDAVIPTIESLNMPNVLYDLCKKPQGLILVTGPTGSGKSTTLAAMIDYINQTQAKHIITLEDPIEYLHGHQKSIVNQREVGSDTQTFANGLRAALRQDPDIILVGEMRDLDTISTAITAAETGHLVMATLHTSSAPTTIDRIIDVFPPHQQGQIRIQLANVLQGIISQRLFKRVDQKGRIAATEVLTHTPSIANLIRNDKVHQIANILQTSRALGMHTLEASIQKLLSERKIDFETAQIHLNTGEY